MSVFIETWKGLRGFSSDIEVTKQGKAFAENQRTGECFEEAGFQALKSQLWSIHWTLCWPSDPQVKDVWMREEQVNDKCNWSETQVTLECPRWNVSARRVSRECPPRAGCRPKSNFYQELNRCSINLWDNFLDFFLELSVPVLRMNNSRFNNDAMFQRQWWFLLSGFPVVSKLVLKVHRPMEEWKIGTDVYYST